MQTEDTPRDRPPANRPKPRFRPVKIVIPAAAIIIAGSVFTYLHGGVLEVLRVPPARDSSTPASQQGYTLVDIVRRNWDEHWNYAVSTTTYGETRNITLYPSNTMAALPQEIVAGLWIQAPDFPMPPSATSYIDYRCVDCWNRPFRKMSGLNVTGKTPDGGTFGLHWVYFTGIGHPLLFVPIPTGYPSSLKYLDVTVTDNKMRIAHWRVDRLPAAQHLLAGSPKIVNHFQHGNISMTAEAVREHCAFPSYDRVQLRLYPRLTKPDKQWDLSLDPLQAEWMAYDRPPFDWTIPILLTGDGSKAATAYLPNTDDFFSSPFVSADRFAFVSGRLRQFDTLRETLTFRGLHVSPMKTSPAGTQEYGIDVNTPLTQSTPSGVRITIPTQTSDNPIHGGGDGSISLFADISPKQYSLTDADQEVSLSNSPLQRAYGKSPKLKIAFGKEPVTFSVFNNSSNDGDDYHQVVVNLDNIIRTIDPKTGKVVHSPAPKTIDLTVTIDQRVDLQEIPFAFTLPVRDLDRSGWKTKPWTVVQP